MLVSGRVHNRVVHSTVLSMNVDFIHSDWEMSRFETLALKKIGSLSCIQKINQCSNQCFLDFLTKIPHFEVPKKTLSYGIILIGPYGIHTFSAISKSLQLNLVESLNQPARGSLIFSRSMYPPCIVCFGVQALWSTDSVGPETMPGL